MTPLSIKQDLDTELYGQEKSKEIISFAFYLHLLRNQDTKIENTNNIPLPKSHILIIGSSGSGKRLMMSSLVKKHDIPSMKIDCSIFLSGQSFHEIIDAHLQYLVMQYGFEKAKKAVIIFEDFDKIANRNIAYQLGLEIQDEMLSLIEQFDRMLYLEKDKAPVLFPIQNLMFVFSGVFAGIEPLIYMRSRVSNQHDEILKKKEDRLALVEKYRKIRAIEIADSTKKSDRIGFKSAQELNNDAINEEVAIKNNIEQLYNELKEDELDHLIESAYQKELLQEMSSDLQDSASVISKVQYQDLLNYGMLSELAGRIGFIAPFEKLNESEIIHILKRPNNNIIDLYKNYFKLHGDELIIEENVYTLIAKEVAKRNIGTRSINTIIVQLLENLLYKAPNELNEKFIINEEYFREKIAS